MSHSRNSLWWAALCLVVAYLGIQPLMPRISGIVFPQVHDFRITSIEPMELDPLRSRITFEFVKAERDCTFVGPERGIEWYRGRRTNGVRVGVMTAPENEDRGTADVAGGEKRSSRAWIVDMPPSALLENSEGYFRFHCHPFWENLTKVWPQ